MANYRSRLIEQFQVSVSLPKIELPICIYQKRTTNLYLPKKNYQFVSIKASTSLSLNFITNVKYWMWFSFNIFDKFHFCLYECLWYRISIYMLVYTVDSKIERVPSLQKFETHWFNSNNCGVNTYISTSNKINKNTMKKKTS